MYCTTCGRELKEAEVFCPSCGRSTAPEPEVQGSVPRKRLSRPMHEKKIAGVCAGFARYLNIDVTLIRIVWLVVALAGGTGIIAYLVAWIAMPKDYSIPSDTPPPTPQRV